MIDMERLFELLEEAMFAVQCNCPTTTQAYVKMARQEWFRLVGDAGDRDEESRFRAAALFIDGLIMRQLWNGKPFQAARNAYDFWCGYDSGANERTLSKRTTAAFRRGYRFGKDGT